MKGGQAPLFCPRLALLDLCIVIALAQSVLVDVGDCVADVRLF
jgi:hypothetical protein